MKPSKILDRNYKYILFYYYYNDKNLSFIAVKYIKPKSHPNNVSVLYGRKCNKNNAKLYERDDPNILVL